MFSMKFMGDNLVLLSSMAEVRMEELVKLNKEWFNNIKPWSASEAVSYKRVWVRCYGVSFHLWSKECLSKVVGEVATVVEVDEATLSWECLEYARCYVRLLRSCKAELSKVYQINGSLYNITIVEEVANTGGVDLWCKCNVNYEGSSGSVSSFDSFVADSLLSAKLSNEEDGKEGGNDWWPEKDSRGEGGWSIKEATKSLEKEGSERHEFCQQKRGLSLDKKDLSEQGVSVESTTMSVTQKCVSDACVALHKSLVNLVEVVETVSNSCSKPNYNEAQYKESCAHTHADSNANCNTPFSQVNDGGGNSSTEGSDKGSLARGVGNNNDVNPLPCSVGSQPDENSHREVDDEDGEEGEGGNEKPIGVSRKKGEALEEARITPERVRHLRLLWEQGTRTVQRRWRSKGGLGSLHQGNKYQTKLNSKTYATSDSEIVECNNRIRREVTQSEATRIWELGKRLGTTCSGNVSMLIKEMETLEDRDNEILSKFKGGTRVVIP